jgi:hypothetical protein
MAEVAVEQIADDYLVPSDYANRGVADANGIVRFTHENEKNYFAVVNADGTVKFRSEGYSSASARDSGAESFLKNAANSKFVTCSLLLSKRAITKRLRVHFLCIRKQKQKLSFQHKTQ